MHLFKGKHQTQPSSPKLTIPPSESLLSIRDQIHQRVLPRCLLFQEFITHLTGCPYTEQTQLLRFQVYHYIALYLTTGFGGVTLSWISWVNGWISLVLVGWILTLGGVSGCNFGLIHQASHGRLTGHKVFDRWFCQIVAVLIIVKDFIQYTVGHATHHKAKTHQTSEDNTIKLLASIGIQPGERVELYWKKLRKIWMPSFLVQFILTKRLYLLFCQSTPITKILAWSIWGLILSIVALTHSAVPFLVAYIIPVLGLFSPLFILRHFVEHKLPSEAIFNHRDRLYVASSTDAVFLGEAPPKAGLQGLNKLIAWSGWWFRMLFWHGLIRWTICPYDVPVHDYHTRMAGHPKEDSPNALWHRQTQKEAGSPGWPMNYTEVWGFFKATEVVLSSFSQLPSDYRF